MWGEIMAEENNFSIPAQINPLLQQAITLIEAGDFQNGGMACLQLLNAEPQNALGYLYLSMAENAVANRDMLVNIPGISQQRNFAIACQLADPALAAYLNGILARQQQAMQQLQAAQNLNNQLRTEIGFRIQLLERFSKIKNLKQLLNGQEENLKLLEESLTKEKELLNSQILLTAEMVNPVKEATEKLVSMLPNVDDLEKTAKKGAKKRKLRVFLILAVIILLGGGGYAGWYFWQESRYEQGLDMCIVSSDGKTVTEVIYRPVPKCIVPNGVTTIAANAFQHRSFQEIILPESLTTINAGAFDGCSRLTSINIPDSVTTIGARAFYECSSLTEITLPQGITVIDANTFYNCSSLTGITIPDGVTTIGISAFENCSGLTEVIIPDSVTSIADNAFKGCSNLTSITIPASVKTIGDNAFDGCSNLTSVIIPDGCNAAYNAFPRSCSVKTPAQILRDRHAQGYDVCILSADGKTVIGTINKDITRCIIPDGVTAIGNDAFAYCKQLRGVTIPAGVTSIGDRAFEACEQLWSVDLPTGVKTIGSRAFSGCTGLIQIAIPEGVTSIGDGAFSRTEITSCTIPESVTHLGNGIFSLCSKLSSVTFKNHITKIPDRMFESSGLTSFSIPETVTEIGEKAFSNCYKLTRITIPSSVTTIGVAAFESCGFTILELPANVTLIREKAFSRCDKLTNVTLPANIRNIENETFYRCTKLTSITIPAGVTAIGERAFAYCTVLRNVELPSSLTTIGKEAFEKCENMIRFVIPDSITAIPDAAFKGCELLSDITIPSSVTSIGAEAFRECGSLRITIPDSITSIGDSAFRDCRFTRIAIPAGVTSIGTSAFAGTSIRQVIIPDNCTLGEAAFPNFCTVVRRSQENGQSQQGQTHRQVSPIKQAVEGNNNTSLTWTTGGTPSYPGENVNWSVCNDDGHGDNTCVTSGGGGAGNASSWLKTTVVGPCKISFHYKVQTYNGRFTITCDSRELHNYSGITGLAHWQYAEYDIPAGEHTITFTYIHSGMGYANALNGVRIDGFRVSRRQEEARRQVSPIKRAVEGNNNTSLTWTTGGTPSYPGENVNWSVCNDDGHGDNTCVTSGGGGAGNASSWLKTTVVGPCKISFHYKVQTYNGRFTITCDSRELHNYSGITGLAHWQYAEYDIPAGEHTITFTYIHSGMGYANALNGVRIDGFRVTSK